LVEVVVVAMDVEAVVEPLLTTAELISTPSMSLDPTREQTPSRGGAVPQVPQEKASFLSVPGVAQRQGGGWRSIEAEMMVTRLLF
jgi:hypothetical protein